MKNLIIWISFNLNPSLYNLLQLKSKILNGKCLKNVWWMSGRQVVESHEPQQINYIFHFKTRTCHSTSTPENSPIISR